MRGNALRATSVLRLIALASVTGLIACSAAGDGATQGDDQNVKIAQDSAQYLLEGYGSGSPDTGVDEWDVVLAWRGGQQLVVARGFKDAVGQDGSLDPSKRAAVIDVVSQVGSSSIWFEVPDKDEVKGVDASAFPAFVADFEAMSGALAFQSAIAAAAGSSGQSGTNSVRILTDGASDSCGSSSKVAAGGTSYIKQTLSQPGFAPVPTATPANNSVMSKATHACPVQTPDIKVSGNSNDHGDVKNVLGATSGLKRFFERNRKAIVGALSHGRDELLGLLRCLFGQVVTGIYVFGSVDLPSTGIADFIAKKGVLLGDGVLPKAFQLVPELANASDLYVEVEGGLDISGGVTHPDVYGDLGLYADHNFHIPFIGDAHFGVGVTYGYDFSTKAWDEQPTWVAQAGDIPLSFGV
jgi:hypothetical protein